MLKWFTVLSETIFPTFSIITENYTVVPKCETKTERQLIKIFVLNEVYVIQKDQVISVLYFFFF